nr:endo-1,4-beta-xylanase [Opitutaceae bacterium]
MRFSLCFVIWTIGALSQASSAGFGAVTALLPPGPQSLTPSGPRVAELGRFGIVSVTGQTFSEAVSAETLARPAYPWDVQLGVRTIAPVAKGDTLWVGFTARRLFTRQETGEALLELIVERSAKPHEKLLERALSVGPEWTRIAIPFVADRDAQTGELQLTLRLGYNPQSLEIGGLALLNHGSDVAPESLPRTDTSYEGSAPDHPWRAAAAARIDQLRKADLVVRVLDTQGRPVRGARVEVRMRRHAFGFGTAVQAARFGGPEADSPDNARYRETVERYFNKIVFENDLKWPQWAEETATGRERRQWIARTLDWAEQRRIPARGHVMVWPSWRYLPRSLRALESDPAALGSAMLDHIADQTGALGPRLAEWDVVNETYAHHQLLDLLGREAMADWFKAARAGAPTTRLYYNDYTMFSGEGPGSPSQHFHDTLRFLVGQGAPIGGIGEQGHFGGSPPPPPRVLETLDRFAV